RSAQYERRRRTIYRLSLARDRRRNIVTAIAAPMSGSMTFQKSTVITTVPTAPATTRRRTSQLTDQNHAHKSGSQVGRLPAPSHSWHLPAPQHSIHSDSTASVASRPFPWHSVHFPVPPHKPHSTRSNIWQFPWR